MYSAFQHENVRTTPFYQLVLDLLATPQNLHPAELFLLVDFVKSIPKISKQTPDQLVSDCSKNPIDTSQIVTDLQPYKKAHLENMPKTGDFEKSAIFPVIRDTDQDQKILEIDKNKYFLLRFDY